MVVGGVKDQTLRPKALHPSPIARIARLLGMPNAGHLVHAIALAPARVVPHTTKQRARRHVSLKQRLPRLSQRQVRLADDARDASDARGRISGLDGQAMNPLGLARRHQLRQTGPAVVFTTVHKDGLPDIVPAGVTPQIGERVGRDRRA